jgi:hypothetical protein
MDEGARVAGRPRRRIMRRGRRSTGPKQPFSLILNPDELSILRKMARQEGTSVASVIRQALHTVIFRTHPDIAKNAIEREVDSFLDSMGDRVPSALSTGSRRARIKKQLVSGLMQTRGK